MKIKVNEKKSLKKKKTHHVTYLKFKKLGEL